MATLESLAASISALQEAVEFNAGEIVTLKDDANAFWLIFGGVLVFWMQAGFAMLEVGTVHKKNTKNILVKNFFDASIASIMWWFTGNALAGGGGDDFTSDGKNGMADSYGIFNFYPTSKVDTSYKGYAEASWFFAWTFAGAAATIVSGAVAERCSFTAYICYAICLSGFVYPPVVHMMWGSGKFSAWRSQHADDGSGGRLTGDCGVIDFAGSGTVHMTGGVAAFVAAAAVGPRKDRWDPAYVPPYGNPVYQALGVFILWTGWYGFNAASTLAITNGYGAAAAHVCVTTTIAASTGCLSATLVGYLMNHTIDPGMVNNGVLAGLVSITSPCATCNLVGSCIIGVIAGPVYVGGSALIKMLKIDDVVDAIAVHGICGIGASLLPRSSPRPGTTACPITPTTTLATRAARRIAPASSMAVTVAPSSPPSPASASSSPGSAAAWPSSLVSSRSRASPASRRRSRTPAWTTPSTAAASPRPP